MSDPGTAPEAMRLPDHPIRGHWLWQAFDRLWRPSGGWACVGGLGYGFILGPAIDRPVSDGALVQLILLTFALWGLKTREKEKGVA